MARREPFTPSADDLRLLSEHLLYEVQMTFFLAALLVGRQGQQVEQMVVNVHLDAFTMHVRQLIDFFWKDRRPDSGTTAFAADYFSPDEWRELCPEQPELLSEAVRRKIGWGVAHLTYDRAWANPLEKGWDVAGLARALAPTVICFVHNVDRANVDQKYFDYVRQWPEQFL
jgi:hypothetical protein